MTRVYINWLRGLYTISIQIPVTHMFMQVLDHCKQFPWQVSKSYKILNKCLIYLDLEPCIRILMSDNNEITLLISSVGITCQICVSFWFESIEL